MTREEAHGDRCVSEREHILHASGRGLGEDD